MYAICLPSLTPFRTPSVRPLLNPASGPSRACDRPPKFLRHEAAAVPRRALRPRMPRPAPILRLPLAPSRARHAIGGVRPASAAPGGPAGATAARAAGGFAAARPRP